MQRIRPTDDDLATPASTVNFCERLKQAGNDEFGKQKYVDAESFYSDALMFIDSVVNESPRAALLRETLLSNRAQCSILQGNFDEAIQNCRELLLSNPRHPKGLYRQGVCAAHLGLKAVVEASATALDGLSLHAEASTLRALPSDGPSEDEVECALLSPVPSGGPVKISKIVLSKALLQSKDGDCYSSPLLQPVGLHYKIMKWKAAPGANQFGTILMAVPDTGLAPPHWCQYVGEVVLFRADYGRTSVAHAWALWDYIYTAMDYYGGESATAHVPFLTRKGFDAFMKERNVYLDW